MRLHRIVLLLFSCVSLGVGAQIAPWTLDTNWVSDGWTSADAAGWEDLRGMTPWGNDAVAAAVQVYAEEGGSHPLIVRIDGDAETHVLLPFGQDIERPIQIETIQSDASQRLWCAINQLSHDSNLTSIGGVLVLDVDGAPDSTFGSDSLPGWLPISFGSPFQELHGLDKADHENGAWMASGMVLDPCCFHREMPTLALLDSAGQWVESFSENGRIVVDVGAAEIVDTLGLRPVLNRHEIGGFYTTSAATDGGWIAAGAYSNASHYEVLVAKHLLDGSLDSSFGEAGLVHLNLNPGVNHWAQDVHIENDGVISLNIVSHAGGDLPNGWHALTLDATGTPNQSETAETANTWTSIGFLNTMGDWPLGIGFEQGALAPSLVSYSNALAETPHILDLDPSFSPEGIWGGFQCIYHPAWNGLVVAGRLEEASNEGLAGPQLLFSFWHDDATHVSPEFPTHSNPGQPYPNPILAGTCLQLDQVEAPLNQTGTWVLRSINGSPLARWPAHLKSIEINSDFPSGIYMLEGPSQSMPAFRLIIE